MPKKYFLQVNFRTILHVQYKTPYIICFIDSIYYLLWYDRIYDN